MMVILLNRSLSLSSIKGRYLEISFRSIAISVGSFAEVALGNIDRQLRFPPPGECSCRVNKREG